MEMFYYTIYGGRLAGLPGPAFMEWDFARLRKMGFSVVVSLECDRLNTFEIEDAGFEHKKICVQDFAAPTFDQVDEFVAFVDSKIAEGKKVLVHCYAGRGRTGTMLAAYLIHQGMSSDAAVREIRDRADKAYGTVRGVIEPDQEELVHQYDRRLKDRRSTRLLELDELLAFPPVSLLLPLLGDAFLQQIPDEDRQPDCRVDEAIGLPILIGYLLDRKSTRLNSSHGYISYAVFCFKKKKGLPS